MASFKRVIGSALGVVALGVAGLVGYAAMLPDHFEVTRSMTVSAPPEKIFPMIANMKTFNSWNPFAKQDPKMVLTYEGPEAGLGAANSWTSDAMGPGRLAITGVEESKSVTMKLDMTGTMEAHNDIVFALTPQTGGTDVSWTMSGPYPLLNRVFGTVFNMDKMIGGTFEQGLSDLKSKAESAN
jgi:carbon monoxide dehydrogenase subunit G